MFVSSSLRTVKSFPFLTTIANIRTFYGWCLFHFTDTSITSPSIQVYLARLLQTENKILVGNVLFQRKLNSSAYRTNVSPRSQYTGIITNSSTKYCSTSESMSGGGKTCVSRPQASKTARSTRSRRCSLKMCIFCMKSS